MILSVAFLLFLEMSGSCVEEKENGKNFCCSFDFIEMMFNDKSPNASFQGQRHSLKLTRVFKSFY